MRNSPWIEQYRAAGARVGEYRGSLTRLDGGEAGGEQAGLAPWPPLQQILYDASWRAQLAVNGADARKWLNGMITANVRDLEPGHAIPSFQLDPKGHILADFDIACLGPDQFLLLTDEIQRAGLLARLQRYVFISKVVIEDRGETVSALLLRGPSAPAAAPGEVCDEGDGVVAIKTAFGGIAQTEYWGTPAALQPLHARLAVRALVAGAEMYERDRILSRTPRYGADITEAELPQETGQDDHLSYVKGCYIGQEIVERIRARGAVHRHWRAFQLDQPAAAGAILRAEGKDVGRLTSVTPRDGAWFGLGYVRDPHAEAGARLETDGGSLAIVAAGSAE